MPMKLRFIRPRAELKPYITKLWVFENDSGLVNHGTLIAPNAKPKIIIPYKNALTTSDNKKTAICQEGDICFIGIRDVPVTLGTPKGATGSIGIELTTDGAYRFLNVPMYELTNNLFSFSDLYGESGEQLLHRMQNSESPKQKINVIQDFLISQLRTKERNNFIISYSVNFISSLHGLASIKRLEKKTGYSKRYLDLLFKNHLGISPKTYSTIVRFQYHYKIVGQGIATDSAIQSALEFYYDQAHFIKEFKRYTGYTPVQYSMLNNDFGKYF
jgi:AraC-like DNA-binding protein